MLSLFEANVVAIERHGEQLFLVQKPHRFTARTNPAAAKAVDLTFGNSVLEVARIESFRGSALRCGSAFRCVRSGAATGVDLSRQALRSSPPLRTAWNDGRGRHRSRRFIRTHLNAETQRGAEPRKTLLPRRTAPIGRWRRDVSGRAW